MAEADVFELVSGSIKNGVPVALVTVLENRGSSPGKQGSVMAVLEDGVTKGSVGGGDLEYTVVRQALERLKTGESGEHHYTLNGKGDVDMACGGDVRLYIKVFPASDRLLVVGGGHIGASLYKLALGLRFSVIVMDGREEFANRVRFPEAAEVINEEPSEALKKLSLGSNTYIAIATHSHESDEAALRAVIGSDAVYVGMIGSRRKVAGVKERLTKDNYSEEDIDKIYAPMGLDIANVNPEEIALSILSEMLLVKNSGELRHMKDRK